MDIPQDCVTLNQQYRTAAAKTASNECAEQNRAADCVHICYKVLAKSQEGRESISMLMNDADPYVRLWAASHSLMWSPREARRTLERIRDTETFPVSFTAEMTLDEFDKGKLSFDY